MVGTMVTDEVVSKNVPPSGAACTTVCRPIEPPAPGRFSRMKVLLVCAESRSIRRRAGKSTGPPAAYGTISRTVPEGQSCAGAAELATMT
jgi:hypothetical protein